MGSGFQTAKNSVDENAPGLVETDAKADIAQVRSKGWTLQVSSQAGKAWEKFLTVKLLQKEVPFCETNGSRNCLFIFLCLCWLSVFWTNLKLSPRKL